MGTVPAGKTVAVLYFQNSSGTQRFDPLRKGLAFMLMTDLSKIKDIQLVERVKLQALVEEMGMGASGIVDDKTAPRVGRLLQANYVVGGDINSGKPSELKLDSDVLHVQKVSVMGTSRAEGMLAQIFDLEKKLLFQIIDILKIKLTPEKKKDLERPLTNNPKAFFALIAAIESSDRGDYSNAQKNYEMALKGDPQLTSARDALEELSRLKLITIKKRSRELIQDLQKSTSDTSTLTPDISDLRKGDPGLIDDINTSGQIRVQW